MVETRQGASSYSSSGTERDRTRAVVCGPSATQLPSANNGMTEKRSFVKINSTFRDFRDRSAILPDLNRSCPGGFVPDDATGEKHLVDSVQRAHEEANVAPSILDGLPRQRRRAENMPFNQLIVPRNSTLNTVPGVSQALGDVHTPFLPSAPRPACKVCGDLAVDMSLWQWFHIGVCRACRVSTPEKYATLTKTEAKEDYLLTESELASLPHVERPNPRESRWHAMQLFLRGAVEELAIRKWGSLEAIDDVISNRLQIRNKQREVQFAKKLKELRRRVQPGRRKHQTVPHEHDFADHEDDTESSVSVSTRRQRQLITTSPREGPRQQRCCTCGIIRQVEAL